MLTRDEINEIITHYHDGEWGDFNHTQAVFDIGRLCGHASAQAERIAALETGFKAAHAANQDLSGRIAALEAAAKELEEALRLFVHAGTGDAKLIAWRRVAEGRAAMRALLSGAR